MSGNFHRLRELADGLRVLYVEDDEGISTLFSQTLRLIFPHVVLASNGEEGLAKAKSEKPDLVITDIYMPKMDGLDMASAIKAQDPQTPIVITSAYSQPQEFLRSIDIGVDGYLIKPLTRERLFDVLEKILMQIRTRHDVNTSHTMLRAIIDAVADGIMVSDHSNKMTMVNPALCEMMGYREDELVGYAASLFRSSYHSQSFYHGMWQSLLKEGEWSGEIVNKRKDGSLLTQSLYIRRITPLSYMREFYIATYRDISEDKKKEELLTYEAMHDHLTGLPNRRLMYKDIDSQASVEQFAFMLIDLDGFKDVNDSYGHRIGDQLLTHIASLLKQIVRDHDQVIRFGGDEFAVIIYHTTSREEIEMIAGRIVKAVSSLHMIDDIEVRVGASVGIALYPEHAKSIDGLTMIADKAMYCVKETGKNNFRFGDDIVKRDCE